MKISNKLLLVLSSVTLLAGCAPAGEGEKPECPQCPECTQCETCKECEECKECPDYIVQFEFGLPVSIKLYDNINENLLSEFVFSDYNSTVVIIPEHDWDY